MTPEKELEIAAGFQRRADRTKGKVKAMRSNFNSNMRILMALSPYHQEKVLKALEVLNSMAISSCRMEIVRSIPPVLEEDFWNGFYCETRGNDQWIYLTVKTKRWIRFKA